MREVEAIDLSRFDPYEFRFATHFSLVERLEGKEGYVLIKPVIPESYSTEHPIFYQPHPSMQQYKMLK